MCSSCRVVAEHRAAWGNGFRPPEFWDASLGKMSITEREAKLSAKADIFGFGSILIDVLTGRAFVSFYMFPLITLGVCDRPVAVVSAGGQFHREELPGEAASS